MTDDDATDDTMKVGNTTYIHVLHSYGRHWLRVVPPEVYSEFRRMHCSDQESVLLDEIRLHRKAQERKP